MEPFNHIDPAKLHTLPASPALCDAVFNGLDAESVGRVVRLLDFHQVSPVLIGDAVNEYLNGHIHADVPLVQLVGTAKDRKYLNPVIHELEKAYRSKVPSLFDNQEGLVYRVFNGLGTPGALLGCSDETVYLLNTTRKVGDITDTMFSPIHVTFMTDARLARFCPNYQPPSRRAGGTRQVS